MVAADLFASVSKIFSASFCGVEDTADRLNSRITLAVILSWNTIITVRLWMMKPINCYLANHPTGLNLMDYVENYCFVEGTHVVNVTDNLPHKLDEWKSMQNQKIYYYQWMPYILGVQALLFYLPGALWTVFSKYSLGADLEHIVKTISDASICEDDEKHQKKILQIVKTMKQHFCVQGNHRHSTFWGKFMLHFDKKYLCFPSRHLGNWLSFVYMFIKILYLFNCSAQLYFIQFYIGLGFGIPSQWKGLTLTKNLIFGYHWTHDLLFPRVTMCHVILRQLGQTEYPVVAQCVLPVNMLIEKMYVFFLFWFFAIFLVTLATFIRWAYFLFFSRFPRRLLRSLIIINSKEKPDKQNVKHFCNEHLHIDGVFLMRMMKENVGEIVTADIITALYHNYQQDYCKIKHGGEDDKDFIRQKFSKIESRKIDAVECGGDGGDGRDGRDGYGDHIFSV